MSIQELHTRVDESAAWRWGVVLLVSITVASCYYFYDAISPLKNTLTEQLGWDSGDYGQFRAAYSWPNVFLLMAVVGGIITDRLGIRITGSFFASSMVVGTFLTWYGATPYFNDGGFGYGFLDSFLTTWSPSLKMMWLGFLFYGLGAETSLVVISKVIVKWFRGREVALAMAINLALARLGSMLGLIVSPRVMQPDWTTSLWLCFILMAIGLLAFIAYCFIDVRFDRQCSAGPGTADEEEEGDEPFRLADIGKLLCNPSFLFIVLLCITFYSAVFPFTNYAPDLLVNKWGMSLTRASDITSLMYFGTIIFTPFFGWVMDFKGRGATLMVAGSAMLVVVHLLFALTMVNPFVPMFLLGVTFSLVPAALWPAIARIVGDKRLGTAYGLTFSIQNVGLFLFPILIGLVLDGSNPGVAAAKAAGAELSGAKAAVQELVGEQELGLFDVAPKPLSVGQRQRLLETAKESAKAFAALDPRALEQLPEPYASRLTEAQVRAARFADEVTLENLSSTREDLDRATLGATYDYTWAILMLAVLGLFGMVFACLLIWADRRQGYGLDLPSKMASEA